MERNTEFVYSSYNQDLALINKDGIFIYTIVDNFLMLQYFWRWKDSWMEDEVAFMNNHKTKQLSKF